jgi:hypothetical protein
VRSAAERGPASLPCRWRHPYRLVAVFSSLHSTQSIQAC